MKLFFAVVLLAVPLFAATASKAGIAPMSGKMNTSAGLNPIFFKDNQLNPRVREQLIQIGDRYFNKLRNTIPSVELVDMTFAGDLAGYNYTHRSTIDLQLIVDADNASCDEHLLHNFIGFISQEWQKARIPFAKYTVTISVRMDIAKHDGIYSLLNDRWLHLPSMNVSTKRSSLKLDSAASDESVVEVD